MKEVPLRTQSGVEAQRDAEAGHAEPVAAAAAAAASGADPVAGDARAAAEGPRPWLRSRPVGGDGARAVVVRGSSPTGVSLAVGNGARNGSLRNGAVPAVDVPPTVLPPAPPGLAPEPVTPDGRTDGATSPPDVRPADPAANGAAGADPRDRLLAMLLPDPARALAVVAEAERARDAARRARQEAADHIRDLDRAGEELVAQGLSTAQVRWLLELTDEEAPDRGGRHRNVPASAEPTPG